MPQNPANAIRISLTALSGVLLLVVLAQVTAQVTANAAEDLPVPRATPNDPVGEMLRIPGLPPIPMPPGTRVFGPNGPSQSLGPSQPVPDLDRPKAERDDAVSKPERNASPRNSLKPATGIADAPKSRDKPGSPVPLAEQRARLLDDLFARLLATPDANDAKPIASAIERVWLRTGSDTSNLLMQRAMAAFNRRQLPLAAELLDRVIEIEPDWAEAWNKRATVRFMADDIDGSMADIDHTLKIEPRHFGALSGLGIILQRGGFDKRALEVYRRTLAIYPGLEDVRKIVDKLSIEVEGRDI